MTMNSERPPASVPSQPRHHWSDYVGAVFSFSLIAGTLWQGGVFLVLLPTLFYDFVMGLSFLTRRPAKSETRSLFAKFSAYAASFIVPISVLLAKRVNPDWIHGTNVHSLRVAGYFIWLAGILFATYTLIELRHYFSIIPQARGLLRSGPYRLARHPAYTGYGVQYFGMLLIMPTLYVAGTMVTWLCLALIRIRAEEKILTSVFPEYADYRKRVGMFATFRLSKPAPQPAQMAAVAGAETLSSPPRG